MRILEVHYSTAWAGAERFVVDLCNELSVKHEVYLCTLVDDTLPGKSYYKTELSPAVQYINMKCISGMDIRGFIRLYKVIKEIEPDIVHAHTDALNLWLPSLLYKKQNTFIPYTVWQRKGNINHGSRPSIDISINLILKQSVFQKYANSPTLNSIT